MSLHSPFGSTSFTVVYLSHKAVWLNGKPLPYLEQASGTSFYIKWVQIYWHFRRQVFHKISSRSISRMKLKKAIQMQMKEAINEDERKSVKKGRKRKKSNGTQNLSYPVGRSFYFSVNACSAKHVSRWSLPIKPFRFRATANCHVLLITGFILLLPLGGLKGKGDGGKNTHPSTKNITDLVSCVVCTIVTNTETWHSPLTNLYVACHVLDRNQKSF